MTQLFYSPSAEIDICQASEKYAIQMLSKSLIVNGKKKNIRKNTHLTVFLVRS